MSTHAHARKAKTSCNILCKRMFGLNIQPVLAFVIVPGMQCFLRASFVSPCPCKQARRAKNPSYGYGGG